MWKEGFADFAVEQAPGAGSVPGVTVLACPGGPAQVWVGSGARCHPECHPGRDTPVLFVSIARCPCLGSGQRQQHAGGVSDSPPHPPLSDWAPRRPQSQWPGPLPPPGDLSAQTGASSQEALDICTPSGAQILVPARRSCKRTKPRHAAPAGGVRVNVSLGGCLAGPHAGEGLGSDSTHAPAGAPGPGAQVAAPTDPAPGEGSLLPACGRPPQDAPPPLQRCHLGGGGDVHADCGDAAVPSLTGPLGKLWNSSLEVRRGFPCAERGPRVGSEPPPGPDGCGSARPQPAGGPRGNMRPRCRGGVGGEPEQARLWPRARLAGVRAWVSGRVGRHCEGLRRPGRTLTAVGPSPRDTRGKLRFRSALA